MSNTSTNSWLKGQRKTELVEIAENVGLKNYQTLLKSELEVKLDEYLAEHSSKFSNRSDLSGYYNSRSKALGSPVKKESVKDEVKEVVKSAKRRVTKLAEEITPSDDDSRGTSTALVSTPGRSLSQVAARIPLPATPADVARAVDHSTIALRKRVNSVYRESGITEASQATREALSTVQSVVLAVSVFELFFIRPEVLPNRFAFTIPAINLIGTSDYSIYLPDVFLLVTASFWSPVLTWVFTSYLVPSLAGYFINLSANSSHNGPKTRSKSHAPEYNIDPLTFSIAKALLAYVVYAQGVTFGGLLPETAIARLDRALYGGYTGVLTGTAITGLVSMYDAVLRK